ncbi:MAG: T9SS type A sorting domain-containing protein, partial [Bacteroidia bacterium]|nr:T9SS type A sorting domain-containing protein [Bacteroidia bacterium]
SYTATDPSGNVSIENCRVIRVIPTGSGISDISDRELQIYPNPTKGKFNIVMGSEEIRGIIISNLLGKVIQVVKKDEIKGNRYELNLEGEPAGVYTVKISTGSNTIVKRVEISR